MKCVCPSGGSRTCPDDCLLAVWHGLPADDQKKRRKPIAEQLCQQGYTQEYIATQLGVNRATISRDLREFVHDAQIKTPKTASNPKGAGRPKGKRGAPKPHPKRDAIVARADQGRSDKAIAAEIGIPERTVRREVEFEQTAREAKAQPDIDRALLSMSAQEKLDAAIKQHQRKLDLQFEQRVLDEVKRRIDQIVLPHWKKQIDEAQQLYRRRRGAMDKATFNRIRRGLHPDSRNSISDKVLGEAFDTFMGLEKFLLNEDDSPTEFYGLPGSWDEWERAKQKATAERRARRANGMSNALRPR